VTCGRSIAVIDTKDKAKLSMKDVYQIDHFGRRCKTRWAKIYVANDTQIPEDMKEYTEDLGVRIIRTQ